MKLYRTKLENLDALPDAYRTALLACGTVKDEVIVHTGQRLALVLAKFAPNKLEELGLASIAVAHSFRNLKPIPEGQWPDAVKRCAANRIDGETGVGDTAERLLGATGEALKRFFKEAFGRECRCKERKEKLNRAFPYVKQRESIALP